MTASQFFDLPSPYILRRGGMLEGARLCFETWGTLNADASNALLIFTGLSPSAHAASSAKNPDQGWWESMLGPHQAIDSQRFFVICVNSLGSCKGSTGPASINPATGQVYAMDYPELTLEDVAESTRPLLEHLGIAHLKALIGPSMGGMTAMAFAAMFPGITANLLLISTAPYSLPFATAIRSLQREAIRHDPHWDHGRYAADRWPEQGFRIARKLGMISYRSPAEWRDRFGRKRINLRPEIAFEREFEVEAYLDAHADRFVGSFDPNCYLYLSRAMDWFDLSDHGGAVEIALATMHARRALVIGVTTDILFPIEQQREIAEGLRNAGTVVDYYPLPSIQGHDSFLVDFERFAPLVADFLGCL
ncbi:MAG: homoserine O-acetyltransferase [Lysobacterales bacterium CG02_land_8_20_14_3_00_62_12]|nr:MAG: homoserine O-acetyltransferase [Xanthomonadales bacterium CG02_land_8_20_14_3_00_62_12]